MDMVSVYIGFTFNVRWILAYVKLSKREEEEGEFVAHMNTIFKFLQFNKIPKMPAMQIYIAVCFFHTKLWTRVQFLLNVECKIRNKNRCVIIIKFPWASFGDFFAVCFASLVLFGVLLTHQDPLPNYSCLAPFNWYPPDHGGCTRAFMR